MGNFIFVIPRYEKNCCVLPLDEPKGSQKGTILHRMRSDGVDSELAFRKDDGTTGREIDYLFSSM